MNILRQVELEHMKPEIPDFGVGDSVDVHYLIREGEKERVQLFSGIVIALNGSGISRTATVRRIVAGEGVERTFPLHSPRVADIRVNGRGQIRRAKLYYLRDREGKATRLDPNLGKLQAPRSGKGSGIAAQPDRAPPQDTPNAE
jgi:large subunit ribosomal protein L19